MGTILLDAWNRVFKNSTDVIEDQVNTGLVALAAIDLAIKAKRIKDFGKEKEYRILLL